MAGYLMNSYIFVININFLSFKLEYFEKKVSFPGPNPLLNFADSMFRRKEATAEFS